MDPFPFLSRAKSRRTKDEGNAPESMHAGRVFRGQVVPGSKNFCRGVDLPRARATGRNTLSLSLLPLDNDTFLQRSSPRDNRHASREARRRRKTKSNPDFFSRRKFERRREGMLSTAYSIRLERIDPRRIFEKGRTKKFHGVLCIVTKKKPTSEVCNRPLINGQR